ncbi:AsmA family protein [Thiomicrorhabdus indica]|uniref:AsmA family protein n=1 Tax=Thiomicrorhabdus indica TaxID=2267253 RepID=UPI002AA913FC|nr:AsmA family protein [Thiomicrorhabdus indica]
MQTIRLLLKVLLGLFTVVVLAVVALVVFVDPNDFKDDIKQVVETQTGREFEMQSIELSFFPKVGLQLQKVKLSNAQGFSEQPFAQIDSVNIGAEILPLFSQQLIVDTLGLTGLKLSLEKNKDGTTNWQDLAKSSPAGDETTEDAQASSNPLEVLKSLQFGGLNIVDGQVAWLDDSTDQAITLNGLNITSGQVRFGEYFPMEISVQTELKQPNLSSDLTITLEAQIQETGKVSAKNIQLVNSLNSKELPMKTIQSNLKLPQLVFDLTAQTLTVDSISIEQQATAQDGFIIEKLASNLSIKEIALDLAKQTYEANDIALNANVESEQLGLTANDAIQLTTALNASLAPKSETNPKTPNANLENLTLSALGTATTGNLKALNLLEKPAISGSLATQAFDLKAILSKLKISLPEMSNAEALKQVAQSFDFTFDVNAQAIKVSNVKVQLDKSTLIGKSDIRNFSTPAVKFDFALDTIKIDDYLPPKIAKKSNKDAPVEPTSQPSQESTGDIEIPLPTELLRQLNLDGQVKIADLTYDKLNPKNILVKLKAQNGKIDITPAKADIFNTQVTVKSSLDVQTDTPKYFVDLSAPKVPVGDVLLAFIEKDPLTGLGSVKATLNTQGNKLSLMKANLSGTAYVDLKDGAVKGFNLAQMIREAKAKISGSTAQESTAPQQTDFSQLIANISIKNGLVTDREISAMTPFMRVQAQGNANLAKETIDFLVKTKIVGTSKGQGGDGLEDLTGLTVPVKVQGTFTDPKFSLDLKSLLDAKMKQKLDEKKDELKQKAQEKVQDELKGKLDDQVQDKLKDALKGFGF